MHACIALLVSACGLGYKRPTTLQPPRGQTLVDASFDKTWNAVLDLFARRTISIETIERASGFIAARPLSVNSRAAEEWADCGTVAGAPIYASDAVFNVLVRGDNSRASILVSVRWITVSLVGAHCISTGRWEAEAELAIKAAAEGRPISPTGVASAHRDSTPPPEKSPQPGWVGSTKAKVFFQRSCPATKKIVAADRVYFDTEDAAKQAGYARGTPAACNS